MTIVKKIFWDFLFVIERTSQKLTIVLSLCSLIFVGLVLFGSKLLQDITVENPAITQNDIIVLCLYLFILITGIAYNYKSLSGFFWQSSLISILVSVGRTVLLVAIALAIVFLIKFIAITMFQVPPMRFHSLDNLSDLVLYYPMIQLPLFFYQFKKYKDVQD